LLVIEKKIKNVKMNEYIVIVFELTYSLEEFALYIKDLLIIKHQLDYIFSLFNSNWYKNGKEWNTIKN
jgi:hypothetical protein